MTGVKLPAPPPEHEPMKIANIALKIVLFVPPVMFSIVLHEFMHAYSAYLLGDRTAKNQGRLTLNPIKHIDPVGTIILPLILIVVSSGAFFFGWAKPVPVNVMNTPHPKRSLGLTALAGPMTNLTLAVFAATIIRSFEMQESIYRYLLTGKISDPVSAFMFTLLSINIGLVILNMLPIPPLDGGRVAVWLLPDEQAKAYASIEPYGMFIILFLIVFNPFGMFDKMAIALFKILMGA